MLQDPLSLPRTQEVTPARPLLHAFAKWRLARGGAHVLIVVAQPPELVGEINSTHPALLLLPRILVKRHTSMIKQLGAFLQLPRVRKRRW